MGATPNEDRYAIVDFTLDPASVGAGLTAEVTATITGVKLGDFVTVSKPTLNAGLAVAGARISAANTIAVTLANTSTGAIDAGSEVYTASIRRPEKRQTGVFNV